MFVWYRLVSSGNWQQIALVLELMSCTLMLKSTLPKLLVLRQSHLSWTYWCQYNKWLAKTIKDDFEKGCKVNSFQMLWWSQTLQSRLRSLFLSLSLSRWYNGNFESLIDVLATDYFHYFDSAVSKYPFHRLSKDCQDGDWSVLAWINRVADFWRVSTVVERFHIQLTRSWCVNIL